MERAVEPTLAELRRRGIDYRGVLYAGLMLTADGPKVIEYNVRFGDPEAQVVLPRLDGDLAALLAEAAAGGLEPPFVDDAAVTVCGPGYRPTGRRVGAGRRGRRGRTATSARTDGDAVPTSSPWGPRRGRHRALDRRATDRTLRPSGVTDR